MRIGLALSDIMKIIANPMQTYTRCGDAQKDALNIAQIAKDNEVELLVSGLPRNLKGEDTLQTQKTREFAQLVATASGLPVKFVDERLTTVSAERVLLAGNVRRDKRKQVVDKVAAAIILQSYLDSTAH